MEALKNFRSSLASSGSRRVNGLVAIISHMITLVKKYDVYIVHVFRISSNFLCFAYFSFFMDAVVLRK